MYSQFMTHGQKNIKLYSRDCSSQYDNYDEMRWVSCLLKWMIKTHFCGVWICDIKIIVSEQAPPLHTRHYTLLSSA